MSPFRTFWRTAIAFLLNCVIKCSFQGLVSSSGPTMSITCRGSVSVEPGPLFIMGSNLTVYCTTTKPNCDFRLFVELNAQEQNPVERLNCSTVRLRLANLHQPNSALICKLERDGRFSTVCGLDLHSGYEKEEYQLGIKAHNRLGESLSKPFIFSVKDIVTPDTPHIVKLGFGNGSRFAVLHWNYSEYPEPLKAQIRLRTGNDSWVERPMDLGRGLVKEKPMDLGRGLVKEKPVDLGRGLVKEKPVDLGRGLVKVEEPVDLGRGLVKEKPMDLGRGLVKEKPMDLGRGLVKVEEPVDLGRGLVKVEKPVDLGRGLVKEKPVDLGRGLVKEKPVDLGRGLVKEKPVDLGRGLVKVKGLHPLTHYDFQIRVCFCIQRSTSAPTLNSTLRPSSAHRPNCSRWSPSAMATSPGIAPTRELDVWRVLGVPEVDGVHNVTVLWKPLSPGDYSGQVLRYELVYLNKEQRQNVSCPADVFQCSVPMSPWVQVLYVMAVTTYGTSPPATVHLTHKSVSRLVLRFPGPAMGEGGDSVALSWLWNGSSRAGAESGPIVGSETEVRPEVLLGFVVEWMNGFPELGWQKVARDRNITLIVGLRPGVRYNVSLYAKTTWGLSRPSCGFVYSREEKPVAAPKVSVLAQKPGRVQIQWEELPIDQQRGFITHYNIYVKRLGSDTDINLIVTVPVSEPNQRWLDFPDGSMSIRVTASTVAGEGPQGEVLPLQFTGPLVSFLAVVGFVATVVMVVMVNLMCWSCVRKRFKQTCISLGPIWLSENFPKPGNSNAIRLLKQGNPMRQTWSWLFTLSDTPLSPIEEVTPGEKDESYPIIHTEVLHPGTGEPDTEWTPQIQLTSSHMEKIGYKPQISVTAGQNKEEVEDIKGHTPICERTEMHPAECQGLLEALLLDVNVDLPDVSARLDPSSIRAPKTQCTTQILNHHPVDIWPEETALGVDRGYLDLPQEQTVNPEDTICSKAMPMTSGYFPQNANGNIST
ncbi:hypothetical protein DPEC_G00267140 [Dallia pectoralis]|uniref:Uncharacterized protein n=1 Tax=Dallia pectoralis TaxID=75939 RepID=A0ACC2FNM3_DALPE|nr:hypothetical protein DPEC_G00267140 [Dallia pectoralis]